MDQKNKYKTFIFDCDGVILDSNKLKTQAFYQAALPYGESAAQDLVEYHIQNGGISRYRKFEYFLQSIVDVAIDPNELNNLLNTYANIVREGLLTCDITPGLDELRQALPDTRWLVVSGSDQTELCDIFKCRDLGQLFDGGIFGSPDSKKKILQRELKSGNIYIPALYLGDSKYDHQVVCEANLDFVFVSEWTELPEWQNYCFTHQISPINKVKDIFQVLG